MVICQQCGNALEQDARFCEGCGRERVSGVGSGVRPERVSAKDALLNRVRAATAGRYDVRGEIGRGGMAAVFGAQDLRLHRRVALKVMLPGLAFTEGMAERFELEARTAANLDHPNIVTIFSVDELDSLLFFAMKFVEGTSLDRILKDVGPLPIDVVQAIVAPVAEALDYAHHERVVHRDIKPGNVLLDRRGSPLVTDFGIAKAAESPTLTVAGALVGTPAYMSPEQFNGEPAIAASDQYALGIMAYETLVGEPPFTGNMMELQLKHMQEKPVPVGDLRKDVPAALAAVVMRMLEKKPAARFESLAAAAVAIRAASRFDEAAARVRLVEIGSLSTPSSTFGLSSTPLSPVVKGTAGTAKKPAASDPTVVDRPPAAASDATVIESRPASRTPKPAAPSPPPLSGPLTPSGQRVRISSPQVAALRFDGLPEAVTTGDMVRLTAFAVDTSDTPVPGAKFDWTVSPAGLATVREDGTLVATNPGLATVTVKCAGNVATTSIMIQRAPAAFIRIGTLPRQPVVGERIALFAEALDARGNVLEMPIVWRSASPSLARIESDGMLKCLEPGHATIVARADVIEQNLDLTIAPATELPPLRQKDPTPVRAPRPARPPFDGRLFLRKYQRHLMIGGGVIAALLVAVLFIQSGSDERTVVDPGLTDSAGPVVVTPPGGEPGTETQRVDTTSGAATSGGALTRVDPEPVPSDLVVASVAVLNAPSEPLRVPQVVRLRAAVRNAAGQSIGQQAVGWRVTNPVVATIDARTGQLTAKRAGETDVIASAGGAQARFRLQVDIPQILRVDVAELPGPLKVGETARLTLSVVADVGPLAPAALRDLGVVPRWTSADPYIANVDAESGLVTAIGRGTANLSVVVGPFTARRQVVVEARGNVEPPPDRPERAVPRPDVDNPPPSRRTAAQLQAEAEALIGRYVEAISTRRLTALTELFPTMPQKDRADWERAFAATDSLEYTLNDASLQGPISDAAGSEASFSIRTSSRLRAKGSRSWQGPFAVNQRVTLVRVGQGWKIGAIQ